MEDSEMDSRRDEVWLVTGLIEGPTESKEEKEITGDAEGVPVALGGSKEDEGDSIGE